MKYKNDILLDLFANKKIKRPPVWIMRQAGRILPGYRRIRASVSGFKKLVKSPDLISEVTTEPLDVLKVDAAILFSDILVIPEAMGLNYEIIENIGPVFPKTLSSKRDIDNLIYGDAILENLDYVFSSITKTKKRINGSNPLIGFAGAPWTLFAYMIEGRGSKTFSKARRFLYEKPRESHRLMEMLTESIIRYLNKKVEYGCDVIQLFDSWADILSPDLYHSFCIPYIKEIFDSLDDVPTIFFPKGAWSVFPYLDPIAFDALSLDWKTPADYARSVLRNDLIVQGNIDPCLLFADPDIISVEVHRMIKHIGGSHIVNLGHGVYPDTPTDHVIKFVESVKSFRYE